MEEEQQDMDFQRPQGSSQPSFSHREDLPVNGEDRPDGDTPQDSEEEEEEEEEKVVADSRMV